MKVSKYIKDKLYVFIIFLLNYFIMFLLLVAFKCETSLIIALSLLTLVVFILLLTIEYLRKKKFYTNLLCNIAILDKAYLVLETLEEPDFIDGKILYDSLYEINKSMNENVRGIEEQINDFKEYIEMWIHEVKLPISSLNLMIHNNKNKFDKKTINQIKRIEDAVEQVLYYVRSENSEKDYLINEVSLKKIINNVALKNKDYLLDNKIDLKVSNVDYTISSDSKWLEFIINQIINNSIKYKRNIKSSYIQISAKNDNESISLSIEDNGIGITVKDLPKVFNKSFTGTNGRINSTSTGMGLFIAKNLCNKLGHRISIESQKDKYTKVTLTFSKNDYYEVIK